uniref:Uncharacterized protein n=1 Tax=Oryza glumipatula TaxID=40148 RepID=A0A0E0B665_9ORYZ
MELADVAGGEEAKPRDIIRTNEQLLISFDAATDKSNKIHLPAPAIRRYSVSPKSPQLSFTFSMSSSSPPHIKHLVGSLLAYATQEQLRRHAAAHSPAFMFPTSAYPSGSFVSGNSANPSPQRAASFRRHPSEKSPRLQSAPLAGSNPSRQWHVETPPPVEVAGVGHEVVHRRRSGGEGEGGVDLVVGVDDGGVDRRRAALLCTRDPFQIFACSGLSGSTPNEKLPGDGSPAPFQETIRMPECDR